MAVGAVADMRGDLGKIYRSSYGSGFRMVTASGLVYPADYATGEEGAQLNVIVFYTWGGGPWDRGTR